MKLRFRILFIGLFIGMIGFATIPAKAQLGDVGQILQSSTDDANALAKAYLQPFGTGFGAALNTGWTNTAKPHKKLGFDLTISSGLAIVPGGDKSFDIQNLNLQQVKVASGGDIAQTINGKDITGPTLDVYADPDGPGGVSEQKVFDFNMPKGTDFGYVPSPMIKAGVGLIKDTELMFRYMPETKIGDFGSFNLFGVGAKHGLNQWLPGGGMLPVNLSLMFGYTNMEVGSGFDVTAEDLIEGRQDIKNTYPTSTWDGQKITMNTDAWSINALVGKTLPMISIYGGIGYEASTFNAKTPGSYPTVEGNPDYINDPNNNKKFIIKAVEEPLDISIEGDNGFRALAGFRFRFAIFHISGSYTLSNYSSYNVGFGISFR
ncbi:DUF6588 family protein [Fodinibius halophilus]|uniref:Uncharacterized protein n=1 Tax=Fodinibius halophilus TaxID=1736908 RepID=A0A6M1T6P2_9BACT|nr:DUF6588 family protein [Fodinibius halophilus]NGP86914.1 hypothetical protein [Fodinibius halophilus]